MKILIAFTATVLLAVVFLYIAPMLWKQDSLAAFGTLWFICFFGSVGYAGLLINLFSHKKEKGSAQA